MSAPHDLEAEAAVLGCMLVSRPARDVALRLNVEDFHSPKHQAVFAAMVRLHSTGQPVDTLTMCRELDRADALDLVGGRPAVLALPAAAPLSSHVDAYVAIVEDLAARRRLLNQLAELRERAANLDEDVGSLVGDLERAGDMVRIPSTDVGPAPTAGDLAVAAEAYEYRWLVEDWIERQDRVGVTGLEGAGKSTLLRQWAVQMASGIHPWHLFPIEPLSVLFVDLQDTAAQAGRAFARLIDLAGDRYRDESLHVVNWREGIDLRNRRDFRRVDRLMEIHQPDVLMIGPHYKCYRLRGGERSSDEQPAIECSLALDELLARHDAALFVEMHSPHGDGGDRAGFRPFGPSLWLRWPEFGIGLRPERGAGGRTVEVVEWRGARDRLRVLPRRFTSCGRWPWSAQLDGDPGMKEML